MYFLLQLLQDRADKICEMASVMNQSIQIDEERYAKEQELMSRLLTENKVSFISTCVCWSQTISPIITGNLLSTLLH